MNMGIKQVEGIAMLGKPMLAGPDLGPGSNLKNWAQRV